MNKTLSLKTTIAIAALLALPLAQAATMSKLDYKTGKARIAAEYKTDKAACASFSANAKDICLQQAKAKDRVALAELEFGYTSEPADQTKILVAKAESTYAVAKEKCDDQAGNAKDVCVKEAKAVEVKSLADARLGQKIGQATTDASDAKREADYQVAAERCDALAGDAKNACIVDAKAQFGKP